jgi:hypothetical protein
MAYAHISGKRAFLQPRFQRHKAAFLLYYTQTILTVNRNAG